MAVFGAMISYAMQGLSFIVLRKNMPNIVRPYRSPVGRTRRGRHRRRRRRDHLLPAAGCGLSEGGAGGAAFYVLGILYFALYGRNQLILSPEEEFAMSKGAKAHD